MRVTCVWKVLVVVVVIFCVRALLVLPRFLHSNRAHMEMKMMLEFWRQNAEAKMVPFPTKTHL